MKRPRVVAIVVVVVVVVGRVGIVLRQLPSVGNDNGIRPRAILKLIHPLEENPPGTPGDPLLLLLCPVSLAELLDLVAALDGGLRGFESPAAQEYEVGYLFPVPSLQLAALQGIPFLLVGVDQVVGLHLRPGARRFSVDYHMWGDDSPASSIVLLASS